MAPQLSRSHSETTVPSRNSRRPLSRASTTSFHSTNTQPSHQHVQDSGFSLHNQQPQAFQYTAEEGMILQSASQLTNPNGFVLDPALHASMGHHAMPYGPDESFSHHAMTHPHMDSFQAFEGTQSPIFPAHNGDDGQGVASGESNIPGKKQKKGSTSSIANDNELRRLHRENKGRSIKDVAVEVLANDRGPKAEKTKQVFAMLWLEAVCKRSTGSVPRNRVYSHYATRCGTERVIPLNPASFGKLVRVIFPGIQTRRLGVRGESKYHYVDLSLEEDNQEVIDAERARSRQGGRDPQSMDIHPAVNSTRTKLPADTAVFPAPSTSLGSYSQVFDMPDGSNRFGTSSTLFVDQNMARIEELSSTNNMVRHQLKFPSSHILPLEGEGPVVLPRIHDYVPEKTDPDIADSLTALYRTHCTSLVDCVRFCKEKQLFRLFTQFHGTLTVPVQKLLAHPNLAPWIKECDWLMYQKMIRFVAPLAFQVIPKQVLDFLNAVSDKLCSHISSTFQNLPRHALAAKLGPATTFASLINRLMRVNDAAHAAANMICNDANRDQMWQDWVLYVKPVKVLETALPNCGYSEALGILTSDVRQLLEPLNTPPFLETGIFGHESSSNGQNFPNNGLTSAEGLLDRWATFLTTLPNRFPRADTRTLIRCIEGVGTAALRDITMFRANSFSSWWVTKVWLDEMTHWLVEMGGFMECNPSMASPTDAALASYAASDAYGAKPRSSESSHPESRFSSVDVDFSTDPAANVSNVRGDDASGNVPSADPNGQNVLEQSTVDFVTDHSHDDSGIGMALSDEDLSLGKYSNFISEGGAGTNLGSDNAGGDVVVC
ncbi:MAG: hypothetical protein M1819_007169 [Sarea resinae]|nr:MAG: hypothetical protein M1819_007169 [Sarea resinae]